MTLTACILVLCSAIAHTTWNYLGKGAASNTKSFMVACFLAVLFYTPFLIAYNDLVPIVASNWLLICGTGIFNGLAYWGILVAYKYGDLSFVYPLKNAQPIIYTTIFSYILGTARTISGPAMFGFILIFLGCFLLPIKSYSDLNIRRYFNKAFIWTGLAALGTAGYSTIDSLVLKKINNTIPNLTPLKVATVYIPFMYLFTGIALILYMLIDKSFLNINHRNIQINYKIIPLVSICISLSYLLVFAAYGYCSNVSYVVAFRQIGMPISIIVGCLLLGEKPYFGKIVGGAMIISGLVFTALY